MLCSDKCLDLHKGETKQALHKPNTTQKNHPHRTRLSYASALEHSLDDASVHIVDQGHLSPL